MHSRSAIVMFLVVFVLSGCIASFPRHLYFSGVSETTSKQNIVTIIAVESRDTGPRELAYRNEKGNTQMIRLIRPTIGTHPEGEQYSSVPPGEYILVYKAKYRKLEKAQEDEYYSSTASWNTVYKKLICKISLEAGVYNRNDLQDLIRKHGCPSYNPTKTELRSIDVGKFEYKSRWQLKDAFDQ